MGGSVAVPPTLRNRLARLRFRRLFSAPELTQTILLPLFIAITPRGKWWGGALMLVLWIFWLETLAFIGFMLWVVQVQRPGQVPLTPYHKAALVVYGIALLSCLYGLLEFARRRLAQGKA